MAADTTAHKITVDEWKQALIRDHGIRVTFNEVGADGWDELSGEGGKIETVHKANGPHWIDAYPPRGSALQILGKLIGTYDCNSGTGKMFYPKNS